MADTPDDVRDLSQWMDPADPLLAKAAEQVAKARSWQPEEDWPALRQVTGDWSTVDPALYDAYRRGEPGAYERIAKSVAEVSYTAADVGEAWLDSLNDPRLAARANEDYEAQRARGFADDEDADLD